MVMAYIVMACVIMAEVGLAIGRAYVVMAYVVMAVIIMAEVGLTIGLDASSQPAPSVPSPSLLRPDCNIFVIPT